MKAVAPGVWMLLALGLLAASPHAGLGFYAPHRGVTAAAGDERAALPRSPRDLATVEVQPYMSATKGQAPTVEDIVAFFGLEEDTLPCTITENDGTLPSSALIRTMAARRLAVGSEVKLCLNG
ncbi:MAG: hypothetical protein M3O15_12130 [Acidobacteriota bacterium]|nr:hypothetical protein [Acidobacteriota bacterium]